MWAGSDNCKASSNKNHTLKKALILLILKKEKLTVLIRTNIPNKNYYLPKSTYVYVVFSDENSTRAQPMHEL